MLPRQGLKGAIEQLHPPGVRRFTLGAHQHRIANDIGNRHRSRLTQAILVGCRCIGEVGFRRHLRLPCRELFSSRLDPRVTLGFNFEGIKPDQEPSRPLTTAWG